MRKRSSLLSMPPEFMKGYEEAFITTIKAPRVHERVPGSGDY
jgi:hypothetical protein